MIEILELENLNDFKYWDRSHYEVEKITGTEEECLKFFVNYCKEYPSRKFSTHVWHKAKQDNEFVFFIRRFKTEKLFKIHAAYPPTYVREGKVL